MQSQNKPQPNHAQSTGSAYLRILIFGIFTELFTDQNSHMQNNTRKTASNSPKSITILNPIRKNWSLTHETTT